MSKYQVTLSPSEMMIACLFGSMIRVHNTKRGYNDVYATHKEAKNIDDIIGPWDRDIIGASGVMAAGKVLNLYPNFVVGKTQEGVDLGGKYEVRTTRYENGHLWLHKH